MERDPAANLRSASSPAAWFRATAWGLARVLGLILVVLTIVFLVFSVLPSDPIRNALGVNASEEAVSSVRREFGYDRPLLQRYVRFMSDAARLDFGRSIQARQAVRPMVADAGAITIRNGGIALGVSVLVSFVLTAIAFLGRTKAERAIVLVCRVLTSIPSIIVAIVAGLLVYAALGGFAGADTKAMIGVITALAVYPTCSLAEIGITESTRTQQASFVVAGRGFGMPEPVIFVRCIVPSVLTAWMGQLSNLAVSILLSSAVFEVVFSLPGLGDLLARAVVQNDLPVVQGILTVVVLAFLGLDALFDRVVLPRVAVYSRSPT